MSINEPALTVCQPVPETSRQLKRLHSLKHDDKNPVDAETSDHVGVSAGLGIMVHV